MSAKLTAEEARRLEKEWGIDDNELVITVVTRAEPRPRPEATEAEVKEDEA